MKDMTSLTNLDLSCTAAFAGSSYAHLPKAEDINLIEYRQAHATGVTNPRILGVQHTACRGTEQGNN